MCYNYMQNNRVRQGTDLSLCQMRGSVYKQIRIFVIYMFNRKKIQKNYDSEQKKPVLKCSICNGEQVAGFKDLHTGKFEEVMLIRNHKDLDEFKKMYGIKEIDKEY